MRHKPIYPYESTQTGNPSHCARTSLRRFSEGFGASDRNEKKFNKPNHDMPALAETRAKTRAIQDLLGISAEG